MAAIENDLWVAYRDDIENISCKGNERISAGTFTKVDHLFDNSGIKSVVCNKKYSMVLTNSGNIFISRKFIEYNLFRFIRVNTLSSIHFIKCIGDTFVMISGPDVTVHIFKDTIRSVSLGLHIDEVVRIFFFSWSGVIFDIGKKMIIYDLSYSAQHHSFGVQLDLRGMEEADSTIWRDGTITTEILDIQETYYKTLVLLKALTQDGTVVKYYIVEGKCRHKILYLKDIQLNNPRIFFGPFDTHYLYNETSNGSAHLYKLKFGHSLSPVSTEEINIPRFITEKINDAAVSYFHRFFVFENYVYCDSDNFSNVAGCDGCGFRIHPFLTELLSRTKNATSRI